MVLFTSTLDNAWNRIPDSGKTFVPFVPELVQHVGARRTEQRNVPVGDPVTVTVDGFPRGAMLLLPGGAQLSMSATARARARRWDLPEIPGNQLERAGVYTVRAQLLPEPIAVQLAASESDLARATAAEVEAIQMALVVASAASDSDEEIDAAASPAAQGAPLALARHGGPRVPRLRVPLGRVHRQPPQEVA